MALAIDPKASRSYVLEDDRELPEAEQTVWYFRNFKAKHSTAIQQAAIQLSGGNGELPPGMLDDVLSLGLTGWDRFFDSDGEEIEFKKERRRLRLFGSQMNVVREGLLDCISGGDRFELAQWLLMEETPGGEADDYEEQTERAAERERDLGN
ncbi:MAG: hypothetical protein AAF196_02945 [Planctomycetota bacterium]